MTSPETVSLIHISIIRSIILRNIVVSCLISAIPQTSAYNLLYRSIMNVNTWSKSHFEVISFAIWSKSAPGDML